MKLTNKQKLVLEWVLKGAPNKEIARRIGISESSVKAHITNIFKKYAVRNRTQLCLYYKGDITPELPTLETKPIGWILKSGDTIKGFVIADKQPDDNWVGVYVKDTNA